jgi:hypothetical protein
MLKEYKVKERCISFMSNPYSYVWELALTYLDTAIKKVFAMHVLLAIVFVTLNLFFIKLHRYHVCCRFLMCSVFLKPKDEDKPIVAGEHVGNDGEELAIDTHSGVEDAAEKIAADSASTERHKKQVQYDEGEIVNRLMRIIGYKEAFEVEGEAGRDNLRAACH